MTTPAKIAANRRNAKHSTGPADTTVTRFNAAKHGLLAIGVTELDSPQAFAPFYAQLESELRPVGVIETFLVHRIALGMVRLKRTALLEAEFLTARLNPPVTELQGGWRNKMEELNGKTVVVDPGLPARLPADAVDALANTFARYETLVENRLFRALNQLEQTQQLRQGEKPNAPVSLEVTIQADRSSVASFGNPASVTPNPRAIKASRVCARADEPGRIVKLLEPPGAVDDTDPPLLPV